VSEVFNEVLSGLLYLLPRLPLLLHIVHLTTDPVHVFKHLWRRERQLAGAELYRTLSLPSHWVGRGGIRGSLLLLLTIARHYLPIQGIPARLWFQGYPTTAQEIRCGAITGLLLAT
jgi:hypothetical protein